MRSSFSACRKGFPRPYRRSPADPSRVAPPRRARKGEDRNTHPCERRWSSESEYGALKEEIEVGGADNDPLFDGIAAGLVKETRGRPGIDALIRREADRATGILGVAVCAGDSIEQATRRAVAAVSPSVSQLAGEERDIWLHIERAGG